MRLSAHAYAYLVLAAIVVCVPSRARADEDAARAHFKKGIDLYDSHRYEAALAEFEQAYKEKPSPGIKQNAALSLKAMNKPALAAAAFDEALEEGKDTLKPETRAAIDRELADLAKKIATVNVVAVGANGRPLEDVAFSVSVQSANEPARKLSPGASRRPVRLMPGIYTFRAHAPGYADPPEKRLALVSGAPVDVTFAFGAPSEAGAASGAGTLTVTASVPDASIRIDGAESGHGQWSGTVSAGPHTLEVSAPGWKTTTAEVVVGAGASVEYPVKLRAIGEAPSEYTAPTVKAPKARRAYVVASGAIDGANYRLSDDLGEPQGGSRRAFMGAALGVEGGYLVSKSFAVALFADVGVLGSKYKLQASDDLESETKLTHWQLMPALRFRGKGKVRFTAGTGVGVHGIGVTSKLARPGRTDTKKGSGVAFAWLVDAGVQIDAGPVFLEGVLFLDVHGVDPVRDDSPPKARLLLASPAVRGGVRIGVGIPF